MSKIKHERTADCVVAGYRVHKSGPDAIGSLLLGLYDDRGVLASVGVIGAFPMATRKKLFTELQPLVTTFDGHPWDWAAQRRASGRRARTRPAGGTPARTCRSCRCGRSGCVEVRYDYMEGVRFRHTAQFVRWRPDRDPESCTYEQLERPVQLQPRRRADQRLSDGVIRATAPGRPDTVTGSRRSEVRPCPPSRAPAPPSCCRNCPIRCACRSSAS